MTTSFLRKIFFTVISSWLLFLNVSVGSDSHFKPKAIKVNCVVYGSQLLGTSNIRKPFSELHVEEGSIAYQFPKVYKEIEEIYQYIPTEYHLIKDNPNITKEEAFQYLIDQRLLIAQKLHKLADSISDKNTRFSESLRSAARRIDISHLKESKIHEWVGEHDPKSLFKAGDDQEWREMQSMFGGESSMVYGEMGEVIVETTLKGVEGRGMYTYQLLEDIVSEDIVTAMKQLGSTNKGDIKTNYFDLFSSSLAKKGIEIDEDLIHSFLDKELDLIRGQHKEWIEVKNVRTLVTWKTLNRGKHGHILKQAKKLYDSLVMLGLENKVKLKQTFVNCISLEAANKFQELFHIEVIGCIK